MIAYHKYPFLPIIVIFIRFFRYKSCSKPKNKLYCVVPGPEQ